VVGDSSASFNPFEADLEIQEVLERQLRGDMDASVRRTSEKALLKSKEQLKEDTLALN
jgi:hypothetical protein